MEQQIKSLIAQYISESKSNVIGDGRHFQAIIVSDTFEGKSKLQRQQMVYQALGDKIKQGEVHALSMKTYTQAEWATLDDKPCTVT